MLRNKLIARLGILVVGFVAGAVVAIVLLQGVLRDLDRMTGDAAVMIDGVQDLSAAVADLEADQTAPDADPGARSRDLEKLRAVLATLAQHPVMRTGGAGAESFGRTVKLASALVPDPAAPSEWRGSAAATAAFWHEVTDLGRIARREVAAEQLGLSGRLRTLIIGLTVAALVMVNISVFVLLRTGRMILKPVGELLEGSRQLERERFEHRVRVEQGDEFGELAHAYNHLAEQLQANEQRKIETLKQLAVTLNHELNNVMSIIECQLGLLDRRAGGDPAQVTHLRQIRENLRRIADTIASLKDLRRIVVTDYIPGQKMLDLPLSTRAETTVAPGAPGGDERHAG